MRFTGRFSGRLVRADGWINFAVVGAGVLEDGWNSSSVTSVFGAGVLVDGWSSSAMVVDEVLLVDRCCDATLKQETSNL